MVKLFPTPNAADATGTHGGGQTSSLRTATHEEAKAKSAQLNPDWVEWLVGLPPGWSDLDLAVELPPHDPAIWDAEPDIPRVASGIPHRVDRLTGLGNIAVPQQFYPFCKAIMTILEGTP